jgi:hypothetical protein
MMMPGAGEVGMRMRVVVMRAPAVRVRTVHVIVRRMAP